MACFNWKTIAPLLKGPNKIIRGVFLSVPFMIVQWTRLLQLLLNYSLPSSLIFKSYLRTYLAYNGTLGGEYVSVHPPVIILLIGISTHMVIISFIL